MEYAAVSLESATQRFVPARSSGQKLACVRCSRQLALEFPQSAARSLPSPDPPSPHAAPSPHAPALLAAHRALPDQTETSPKSEILLHATVCIPPAIRRAKHFAFGTLHTVAPMAQPNAASPGGANAPLHAGDFAWLTSGMSGVVAVLYTCDPKRNTKTPITRTRTKLLVFQIAVWARWVLAFFRFAINPLREASWATAPNAV